MGNSLKKPSKNLEDPLQESHEEDADASFTCEICIEPVLTNKKFKNNNHCAHSFCKECIAKYIELKLEDHIASVQCPGLNCERVLDPLSCKAIISPSVFSKWCYVLCDNYVLGFERGYCPNRNCGELVVNECGGNVKKSTCPNCKKLFCFQCTSAWHPGLGCEESRSIRDPNDSLFLQLVKRKPWIKCPGCGHFVERIKGCNSIQCRCRTEFCYKCGKAVSECECRGLCFCYWHDFYWLLSSVVLIILLTLFLLFQSLVSKFFS